jgi:hypothetical protein
MEPSALRFRQYGDRREGGFTSRVPFLAFAAEAFLFALPFDKRRAVIAAEPHDFPPPRGVGDEDSDLGRAARLAGFAAKLLMFAGAAFEGHGDFGAGGIGGDALGRSCCGFRFTAREVRIAMDCAPGSHGGGVAGRAIAASRSGVCSAFGPGARAPERKRRRRVAGREIVEGIERDSFPHETCFGGPFGLCLFYPLTNRCKHMFDKKEVEIPGLSQLCDRRGQQRMGNPTRTL